uniref:Uncharacterized protein n=1 Tax=Ditylenchus dipsaci TaxID=166011 RepID=A0A915DJ67_9BILA
MAGGVCYKQVFKIKTINVDKENLDEKCAESDMIELKIEFAIMDYLKQLINDATSICNYDDSNWGDPFCTFPAYPIPASSLPGDSGSGFISVDNITNRSTLYGILSGGAPVGKNGTTRGHYLPNGTLSVPRLTLMAGGKCFKKGIQCPTKDMVQLDMDFMAWHNSQETYQDLVIIQLKKKIADETTLRPACIQSRHDQLREIKLIAYGWTKSTNMGNKTSPALQLSHFPPPIIYRIPNLTMYLNLYTYNAPMNGAFPTALDHGSGAVKISTYTFAGMLLPSGSTKVRVYLDPLVFMDVICAYLNFCPEYQTIGNFMPFFDNFYYPSQ